jgi:hypothetical protein
MSYEQLLSLENRIGNVNVGLKQKEINKLGCFTYNKINNSNKDNNIDDNNKNENENNKNDSENNKEECTICLEEFKNKQILRKLKCGHMFHIKCIDKWLKIHKNCPNDKIEVEIPK